MKISAPKMLEKVSLAAILHVQNINVLAVLLVVIMLWVPQFLSPAEAVFLSIDCGASDSYTDSRSISWVGDDEYVRNGQPQQVQVNVPPVFSTLRVFTVLRKNCYTINSADMIGQRILVRAMFYYGNYDGNNSPPAFDLYLDSTYWTKVTTDGTYFVDYEVIYTVSRNTTSICLAQILPGQFPFITSLEFRSLAPTMYSRVGSQYALLRANRIAFGAYQSIIRYPFVKKTNRYPDDRYDREWFGASGSGATQVSGAADISNTDVSPAPDVPPPAVLQNATAVFNTSQYFQLFTNLAKDEVPVYITTFFSEVNPAALTSPNRRSFQVYVDNKPYSQVIVPPFESVKEVAITNITASSATSVTIQSTSDSTLPVLINAFEVYILRQLATDSTHAGDLEGLAVLQVEFEVLIVWSGDPCIPAGIKPWEWVQCSYRGTIPRIIALNLSGYNLVGLLPDFSSMDALVTIDLHDNSLSGPIPDFLGSLPNLRQLDLSSNRFNGSIPTSLSRNKNLKLVVSDNCLSGMSCPPPPPPPADSPPPPPPSSRPSKKTPPAPYYQTPPSVYYSGDDTSPPPPPGSFLFGSGSTDDSKNSALLSILLGATIQALFLFL